MEYIITILESGKTVAYYLHGVDGRFNQDIAKATRFRGYYEAAVHLAQLLHHTIGDMREPVTITIQPAPESHDTSGELWTYEETMDRAG
jgi:hypothetical protein